MIWNPFVTIKDFLQKEIDISLFPLKDLVDQYSSLGEDKWKDLELTTSFLDVTVEILESKIRKLFDKKVEVKNEEKNKEDLNFIYSDDSWRDLVNYLKEKEEKSLLIFRREKPFDIELAPDKKINIAEVYLLFLEKKNNLLINFDYLDEELNISFENKYKEILSIKEGKFSELIKDKPKIDIICYFLALCDLSSKGEIILEQKEFLGEIYFRLSEKWKN